MAFNTLSLELNEQIAMYLGTDREVCDFRLICQATNSAIDTYRCGVFRNLYARRYDMPEKKGGREIMMLYKLRSRLLRKGAKFSMGREAREARCLEVLRDLVLESYANLPSGRKATHPSNNLKEIQRFVQRFHMLEKTVSCLEEKGDVSTLLQTLQLMLTHLELSIPSARANPALGFAYSQSAVYSHPDDFPMFDVANRTWRVSIDLLLHIANFFKHHLTQKGESTLYELFSQLKTHEKPKAWNSKLVQKGGVKKLGKHWRGTYAYLHDLEEMDLIRQCEPGKKYFFIDSIDHHDGFQTLQLDFEPQANRARWPEIFESHLNAMPTERLCYLLDHVPKTNQKLDQEPLSPPGTPDVHRADVQIPRPQTKKARRPTSSSTTPKRGLHYQQFSGSGNDAEPFHCKGILHPLPPQEGIPGWYRISMMKYFDPLSPSDSTWVPPLQSPPSEGNTPIGVNYDHNSSGEMYEIGDDAEVNAGCWAYEGVVLPGGMIMLGRWWSPMDDSGEKRCMGPFIFWNVDKD